jgi:hypothetical protein
MVYAVGTREEESSAWSWGFDRLQCQLSERGKPPARGQVKNRSPLLIREVVFLKISGNREDSTTGQRVL